MNFKDYLLTVDSSVQIVPEVCDQFIAPKFRRRFNSFCRRRRFSACRCIDIIETRHHKRY